LNKAPSLVQPTQVSESLQYKGQWAALLISMHMVFLYGDWRGEGQKFADFLDEQIAHQKRWRSALKITKKEADAAYALFQWCDRLSLILCRRELPEAERALEISTGPDGKRYHAMRHEDHVIVQPWPFEGSNFEISVETRQIAQLSFQNDAELQAVLKDTPVTHSIWHFRK